MTAAEQRVLVSEADYPEIGVELPLSDLYERITFPPIDE